MTARRLARPRLTAAALLVLPLAACEHGAREPDTFAWSQSVPAGQWVRIRNLNGSVRVARAPGGEVHVSATKRYKGGRPERVRFAREIEGGGVLVCALWGDGGRCDADSYRGGSSGGGNLLEKLFRRRQGVAVDFVVALPAGVKLDASTVNGRVTVADASGEVRARTVNGPVTVDASGGPVSAETVNGSVLARVDQLAPGAGVSLETVNGSVTAMLPPSMDGELDLRTTNGSVASDFPLSVQRVDRRRIHGTLGAGGRQLSFKTVNGSVKLERAGGAVAAGQGSGTR